MNSAHFDDEVYAWHALGGCDAVDCAELHSHLDRGCGVCLASLTEAFRFWYLFGSSTQFHQPPVAAPSSSLRGRVVAIAQPEVRPSAFWTWKTAGAALAASILLAAVTWQASQSVSRRELSQSNRALTAARIEIDRLRDRLAQPSAAAPAQPIAPPVSPPERTPSGPSTGQLAGLRDEVTQTRNQLAAEQARVSDLERQLADQNARLSAAAASQALAEQRARESVEQAARQSEGAAVQRADATTLRARVRDLEERLATYRTVVEQLQRRADQQVRLAGMLENPNVSVVKLRGTESGRPASGVALIAGNSVLFFASNLPQLDAKRSYQLWLIRDRGPAIVSGGTFNSWGRNAPAVQFSGSAVQNLTGLAVTEEPAGGSAAPTGHKLLIGTPRA